MLQRIARAFLPLAVLVATSAGAQVATTVTSNGVSGTDFGGSLSLLNDGYYPPNGTGYTTNTVYNYNSSIYFDFAFSGLTSIGSYNLTVDNNDDYTVTFYNGSTAVGGSHTILASDGVVGGGVETFSSSPTRPGTYLASLALATPVTANHVRITTANGDGLYSVGEAEFFAAATSAVPEPAVWTTMILGFGLAGVALRRRVRASEAAFEARLKAIASGDVPA